MTRRGFFGLAGAAILGGRLANAALPAKLPEAPVNHALDEAMGIRIIRHFDSYGNLMKTRMDVLYGWPEVPDTIPVLDIWDNPNPFLVYYDPARLPA